MSRKEVYLLLVGTQNGSGTVEDNKADFYKTVHILTVGFSNLAAYPTKWKSYAHTNTYSSFIYNHQIWKEDFL